MTLSHKNHTIQSFDAYIVNRFTRTGRNSYYSGGFSGMHIAPAVPVVPDASQIMRNGRWLTGVREKIFAGQESPLRDVIAASWQRSMAHGLRPDRFSVPFAG